MLPADAPFQPIVAGMKDLTSVRRRLGRPLNVIFSGRGLKCRRVSAWAQKIFAPGANWHRGSKSSLESCARVHSGP